MQEDGEQRWARVDGSEGFDVQQAWALGQCQQQPVAGGCPQYLTLATTPGGSGAPTTQTTMYTVQAVLSAGRPA